jgi:hypothetical protein
MKTRVNLTIEDDVLKNTKLYAEKQGTSVSELAENYFRSIIDYPKRSNIFDLIDKLPQSNIDTKADLTDLYYQDKAKKYGF